MAVEADDPQAVAAVLIHELAGRQREQLRERGLEDLLHDIELPLVHVAARDARRPGMKLDTARLEQAGPEHARRAPPSSSARSGSSPARSS